MRGPNQTRRDTFYHWIDAGHTRRKALFEAGYTPSSAHSAAALAHRLLKERPTAKKASQNAPGTPISVDSVKNQPLLAPTPHPAPLTPQGSPYAEEAKAAAAALARRDYILNGGRTLGEEPDTRPDLGWTSIGSWTQETGFRTFEEQSNEAIAKLEEQRREEYDSCDPHTLHWRKLATRG